MFFSILTIALVGMMLITSQSQVAFAGVQGGSEDPDGDNIFDPGDNCPNVYNPGQEDVNDDGTGDACVSASVLVNDVIEVVDETLSDVSTLSEGQIDALVSKLQSAADKLDSEKINGAIGSLNAFINQIEAFIGNGQVEEGPGLDLIKAVESIIGAID